jgi:hypothetical protein
MRLSGVNTKKEAFAQTPLRLPESLALARYRWFICSIPCGWRATLSCFIGASDGWPAYPVGALVQFLWEEKPQ